MSQPNGSQPSGGRPPHEPTEKDRLKVEALAGVGVTHEMISAIVGISRHTLEKHYPTELERGNAKATAKVAQRLFAKALAGDTACMIFWMKVRAGWREKAEDKPDETPEVVIRGGLPDEEK